MGDRRHYVCSTGGQRTSHILVHQVAIATAHLRGLPHITVLPLLHSRGSQCRSHVVGTCPIVLQYKRPCGKPYFGVAARGCTTSQSHHTMQSVNGEAKPSAVHIQTSNFKFERGICWVDHLSSQKGTHSCIDPLRVTLQVLSQLSGYCLSAATFWYAVHH